MEPPAQQRCRFDPGARTWQPSSRSSKPVGDSKSFFATTSAQSCQGWATFQLTESPNSRPPPGRPETNRFDRWCRPRARFDRMKQTKYNQTPASKMESNSYLAIICEFFRAKGRLNRIQYFLAHILNIILTVAFGFVVCFVTSFAIHPSARAIRNPFPVLNDYLGCKDQEYTTVGRQSMLGIRTGNRGIRRAATGG